VKISIITVCYNSDSTIAHTLLSVKEQSHKDIEHIIIDGGSTDNTLKVIAKEGAHVAKLVSEPDKGLYDAMNKGIECASGEIIGFINADDFYASTDVLARVADVFYDPKVDACYSDLCYVKQHDISTVVRYWRSSVFIPGSFEVGWCPPHPTFFVRSEIYDRFGRFDLNYKIAADMELMVRFLEVKRIRSTYIPEVLVMMRIGGTTNRNLMNMIKQNKEILHALEAHDLQASALTLIGRKLISRGMQFFVRPKGESCL
jgi:glycosyltransferase involved in cell wall biosynthesis